MASLSKSLRPTLIAGLFCALSAPLSAQSLADSAWVPVEIAGETVEAGEDVLIRFAPDGSVSGNGGCNNFSGSFVTNGDAILVGPIAATMMLCEDPYSAMEMQIFRGLEIARAYAIEGPELELSDGTGASVMTLIKRAAE